MADGVSWLAELALAAASSTSYRVCAQNYVNVLRRSVEAHDVYVFASLPHSQGMSLLASSRETATGVSDGVPDRLPLGQPTIVRPGHPDHAALERFAGRTTGVFVRIPVGTLGRLLVHLGAEPSPEVVWGIQRTAAALGHMIAATLPREASRPPAPLPLVATPFDSDEADGTSGVWVPAEQAERDRARTERFFESVIENIPDMIFVKDAAELRFVRFNRAGERVLGWPRDTLLGKNDYDFFPPEEADFFTEKDRHVLASGHMLDIPEEPIHTAHGTRFLHTKKIPILDDDGTPLYLLGISEDVTEKKAAHEALQERERRFQNLFQTAPVSLWELDASKARAELEAFRNASSSVTVRVKRIFSGLRTLALNDATLELFGATSVGELEAQLPSLLGMGRHGGTLLDAFLDLLDGRSRVERAISASTLSGEPLHLLLRLAVPPDSGQDLAYILIAMTDITALKAAEEAVSRTAEDLRRSNGELQQFASVASHDLQEPLRIIAGFSDLLGKNHRTALPPEGQEFVDFIIDAVGRMQRLIRDLLAYSRVDIGDPSPEPVSLSEPLRHALANLRVSLEESGAQVFIDPEPLPAVRGDTSQLAQVFQNLIGNALKFRSDKRPEVSIRATVHSGVLEVSVSDNGIGFDARHRERIFDIFQRLHGPGRYPGTGIGLAICKKIIERHGGAITADGQPGGGATFRFTLPGTTSGG